MHAMQVGSESVSGQLLALSVLCLQSSGIALGKGSRGVAGRAAGDLLCATLW